MTSEEADQTEALQIEYRFFNFIATLSKEARKIIIQKARERLPKLPDSFPLFFLHDVRRGTGETKWCDIADFRGNVIPALDGIQILESRLEDGVRSIRVSQADARGQLHFQYLPISPNQNRTKKKVPFQQGKIQ